jgi:hypothetical protein
MDVRASFVGLDLIGETDATTAYRSKKAAFLDTTTSPHTALRQGEVRLPFAPWKVVMLYAPEGT